MTNKQAVINRLEGKKMIYREEYLKNPVFCPFCKSGDITDGNFESGLAKSNWGLQRVTCNKCFKEWDDAWKLYDAEEVKEE